MSRLVVLLSLVAAPALAQVRVEPRAFVKERRFFVAGGLVWLDRADLYVSPGAVLSVSWYPREGDGFELRAAGFFSHLESSAQDLVNSTGLAPDSRKPLGLAQLGIRHGLTYGKVALGSAVLHFDVQAGAHFGALLTDPDPTPAASVFVGLVGRMTDRFFFQIDVNAIGSIERRTQKTFVAGLLPLLVAGVEL